MRDVVIQWPDGQKHRGPTFDMVFELLRRDQLSSYDSDELRRVLARRARVWSRQTVDPTQPIGQFFRDLELAHMLRIVSSGE